MKRIYTLIKEDIKRVTPIVLAIGVYLVVSNFVFGMVCPARMFLSIPCPTCGLTRSFLLLAQGKFVEATVMQPMWIFLVLIVIWIFVNRYLIEDEVKKEKAHRLMRYFIYVTIAICLVYYVYRMINWFPNKEPMVWETEGLLYRIRK